MATHTFFTYFLMCRQDTYWSIVFHYLSYSCFVNWYYNNYLKNIKKNDHQEKSFECIQASFDKPFKESQRSLM